MVTSKCTWPISRIFLAFIQTLHFYSYGFNFDLHWDFEASQKAAEAMQDNERTMYLLIGLAFALPTFGLVYSTGQALVLRGFLSNIWQWIASGVAGFSLVLLIVLPFSSIWGDIPGPVEPFTIVFGGAIISLVLQWRYLRKNGLAPTRPFLWYVLGIVAGLAIIFILFLAGMEVSWALEVSIIGFVLGGSAGFFSAKHIQKELNKVND